MANRKRSLAWRAALACLVLAGMLPARAAAAAEPAPANPFTEVVGFATKTGFRGVVAWESNQPVAPVLRYGTSPDALTLEAQPPASAPDLAGMVVADGLTRGTTYWYQVEDTLTGARSPVQSLRAENAYTAWDEAAQAYTINLLVQLDAEELPAEVPGDLALRELGQGMSVFAERVYDATDGYVRLGKVLVTDTNLDYAGSVPVASPEVVVTGLPADCRDAGANLADVLVQTAPPADSHTYGGWSIDRPCTSFYVGRMGWLRVPTFMWEDDLDFGAIAAHELAHYAFDSPDLYPGSPQGDATGADCRNLDWDGSLMHNTGGYNVAARRWEMTELDRDIVTTPCDMGTTDLEDYSWTKLTSRYDRIPASAATVVEHVVDTKARGNEDGGVLDVRLLDREPGASTLSSFTPDDLDFPPLPTCGNTVPPVVDPPNDATGVVLTDRDYAPNEPSLDILSAGATWHDTHLTLRIRLKDLVDAPPPGATGRYFRYSFSYAGATYTAVASRDAVSSGFTITRAGGTAVRVTGTFDSVRDEVSINVPAAAVAPGPALAPGGVLSGFTVLAQRWVVGATPTADSAAGHCDYEVGQELFGENTPPVATGDNVSTTEDATASFDVVANDTDADGDSLVVVSVGAVRHGTAAVAPGGRAVTYVPPANFTGTDDFTYVVSDGRAGKATARVDVTVTPVPDPPTAVDDTAFTLAGQAVVLSPLANDFDAEGDAFSLSGLGPATFGTAAVEGTGVRYTPPAGFTGRDRFTYTVTAADGTSDTATVTVTVVPPTCSARFDEDLEPLGARDAGWRTETAVQGVIAPGISVRSWAPVADPLATSPTHAWFSDASPGSTALTFKDDRLIAPVQRILPTTRLSFSHHYAFEGVDGGVLEVSTDGGATWTDVGKGAFVTGAYNTRIRPDASSPLADRDAWSGLAPTARRVEVDMSRFAGATALVRWRLLTDGDWISAVPGAGWWVDDVSFTNVLSATCVVNTPPLPAADVAAVDEDGSVAIPVLANDVDYDGDPLTVTEVGAAGHGVVTITGDGSVVYAPHRDFNGDDSFTYVVSDGNGGSATASVSVTVRPVNDAPVAANDDLRTQEDSAAVVNVLANDSDADGDALTVALGSPAHGRVEVTPDGEVRYVPAPDFNGTDSFTYEVLDGNGGASIATVTVEVVAVNDAPVAVADQAASRNHKPVVIAVLANDTDVEGDVLTVVGVTRPANGSAQVNPDGTVTYAARKRFTGVDTFEYLVSDASGAQSVGQVTVTVA